MTTLRPLNVAVLETTDQRAMKKPVQTKIFVVEVELQHPPLEHFTNIKINRLISQNVGLLDVTVELVESVGGDATGQWRGQTAS